VSTPTRTRRQTASVGYGVLVGYAAPAVGLLALGLGVALPTLWLAASLTTSPTALDPAVVGRVLVWGVTGTLAGGTLTILGLALRLARWSLHH
jgi:hypothetical protein